MTDKIEELRDIRTRTVEFMTSLAVAGVDREVVAAAVTTGALDWMQAQSSAEAIVAWLRHTAWLREPVVDPSPGTPH